MLDKQSRKILKYAKSQYAEDNNYISLYPQRLKIDYQTLNIICEDLHKEGYIQNFRRACDNDQDVTVSLSYKAFTYTKENLLANLRFWIPIVLSNLIALSALIISILTYLKQQQMPLR